MADPVQEAKKLRGSNPNRTRCSREDEAAWDLLGELVEEVERLRAERDAWEEDALHALARKAKP